jgi:hypothetical protein
VTEALTPLRVPKPLKKKLGKKTVQAQAAITKCFYEMRTGEWQHTGRRRKGSKKLRGREGPDGQPVFEARASRADRVTYYWDGPVIVVENHCDHSIL